MSASNQTPTDYLAEPLKVGEPDVFGALAVYPVWGPAPQQSYVSFAQGRDAGVQIKELEAGASVNDLVVINPTETPVLLLGGEEVLGAQQNRTFDVTALIGANTNERIPVSCMEAGRWDSTRHSEAFAPAPQTAPAKLRRSKALMISASLEAGGEARATSRRSGTRSSTEPTDSRPTPPPGRSTTSTKVAAISSTASRKRSSFATVSPERWSRSAAASECSTG